MYISVYIGNEHGVGQKGKMMRGESEDSDVLSGNISPGQKSLK